MARFENLNRDERHNQSSEKGFRTAKCWLLVAKSLYGASEKVGLISTLEYLQQQKKLYYQTADYKRADSLIEWADNVIFSRVIEHHMIPLLDKALKMNKVTFYYVDDSLYNVSDYSRLKQYYHSAQVQKTLKYFIERTHQVVTCSQWLSKSYDEYYGCKSTWVQPAVTFLPLSKNSNSQNKVIIGAAGNIDYGKRLEEIKEMFFKLHHKYGSLLQFEFFGPKVSFTKEINAFYYLPKAYLAYEKFLAERNWDIGIAYLENSTFSNHKYFNKYLEYGRFKIPGVYSDIPLYNRIVKNQINGLIASNTNEAWYAQIEKLIHNISLRKKITENAYEGIKDLFSPEKGAQSFMRHLGNYF